MTQTYTPENAPQPTGEPYTTAVQRFGIVNVEEVTVAFMPRADFMALVVEALDYTKWVHGVDLTERLWPVAETMLTFPIDRWITDRGCGCVVGEYLVAADIISRTNENDGVFALLWSRGYEDGRALIEMGSQIDRLVQRHLWNGHNIDTAELGAVVFID